MNVIAFLSQKGGSGKTTLSVHTAVAAEATGERVCVIDADPQESATAWASAREAGTPIVATAQAGELDAALRAAEGEGITLAALLQRLAAVRGRLSLCADQAAAAKWWLSMPMASVSAEGPMPKALSTRRTSPLMPGCRHQGRACPLRRARMTSNPLIVA